MVIAKLRLLPSLAALTLLLWAHPAASAADPHSVETIAKNLASLRSRPPIVRYRLELTVVCEKGHANHAYPDWVRERHMEESRAKNLPYQHEEIELKADLPNEDASVIFSQEYVIDFASGKAASKGVREHWTFALDNQGTPRFEFLPSPFEGASDGSESFQRIFVDRKHPPDYLKDCRVPVEFSISPKSRIPSTDVSYAWETAPIFFCEGAMPGPKQPMSSGMLPPFVNELWTRGAEELDSEGHPIIYSLPWLRVKHFQCTLRPDLNYVPCKWQQFDHNQLIADLVIVYRRASDGMPELQSWKCRSFGADGKLQEMTSVRVMSVERHNSIDPSVFRLQPYDGTLVRRDAGPAAASTFFIAGRKTIQGPTIEGVNALVLSQHIRFQWLSLALAAISVGMVTACMLLLSHIRFRQSELPAQGAEASKRNWWPRFRFSIIDVLFLTLWIAALLALWRIHPGVDAADSILLRRENVWKGLPFNSSLIFVLGCLLGSSFRQHWAGVRIGLISAGIFTVLSLTAAFYMRSTL